MPTQILKSEFPPIEQWEEMEIVEDIGTEKEHADTFLRWNNYGIEIHDDGLCQAYVIIQTEDGEIPKKVAEGFSSPEAVIEYFIATEGQKALVEGAEPAPEGNVPVEGVAEVAEIEGEPAPDIPVESPAEEVPPQLAPKEEKEEAPKESESEDKKEEKSEDKEEDKKDDKKDDKNVKKSDEQPAPEPPATSEPTYPTIKSWADMRNEYNSTHQEYQHPISYYQPSAATVRKTEAEKKLNDKARQYPVDTIDHDPTVKKLTTSHITHPNAHPKEVRKSIEFGSEIPSWADMQAGYSFTFAPAPEPIAQAPIAKADVTKTPTPVASTQGSEEPAGAVGNDLDSQIGNQTVADLGDTDSPVPAGVPDGITPDATPMVADFNPEQIAAQLQMEPDQLAQVLSMDGGIEAVASALQGDMAPLEALLAGEAAPAEAPVPSADDVLVDEDDIEVPAEGEGEAPDADDEKESAKGDARISLQSEPTDTL